jgi:hypothetical protein
MRILAWKDYCWASRRPKALPRLSAGCSGAMLGNPKRPPNQALQRTGGQRWFFAHWSSRRFRVGLPPPLSLRVRPMLKPPVGSYDDAQHSLAGSQPQQSWLS